MKQFAADGGRIVFIGENSSAFPADCIDIENQLLRDMGAQMTNTGAMINCAAYFVMPATSLRAHQITSGLTGLTFACASRINLGPNDFALFYDMSNTFVLGGVARIDVTPIPVILTKPAVVSDRPRANGPVLSDPRLPTGSMVPPNQ
jgi:hypothetical protein